jgi:hypothetical protein
MRCGLQFKINNRIHKDESLESGYYWCYLISFYLQPGMLLEKIIDYSHPDKKLPKLNDKNKGNKNSEFDDFRKDSYFLNFYK